MTSYQLVMIMCYNVLRVDDHEELLYDNDVL